MKLLKFSQIPTNHYLDLSDTWVAEQDYDKWMWAKKSGPGIIVPSGLRVPVYEPVEPVVDPRFSDPVFEDVDVFFDGFDEDIF